MKLTKLAAATAVVVSLLAIGTGSAEAAGASPSVHVVTGHSSHQVVVDAVADGSLDTPDGSSSARGDWPWPV